MTNPSPLPWKVASGYIQDADGNDLLAVNTWGNPADVSDANLALVVRAVNCHEELLAAAKMAVTPSCGWNNAYNALKVAIAKAEGMAP